MLCTNAMVLSSTIFILGSLWIQPCLCVRIGVIGGGISGSFASKYLVDYDDECSLEELTIFDPNPLGKIITKDDVPDPKWQGSRVGTYRLGDGRIVELGASVITSQVCPNHRNLRIVASIYTLASIHHARLRARHTSMPLCYS